MEVDFVVVTSHCDLHIYEAYSLGEPALQRGKMRCQKVEGIIHTIFLNMCVASSKKPIKITFSSIVLPIFKVMYF